MIDFVAIVLGLFFVLFDVSVLPTFAKGFIIFDFSLFFINTSASILKEKAFLYLAVIAIFKSFFILEGEIPQLFFIYALSVVILFILERVLNIESIILTLLVSMIFLFVEIKLSGIYNINQIISTLLIHLVVWIFLINIFRSLFNLLKVGAKRLK